MSTAADRYVMLAFPHSGTVRTDFMMSVVNILNNPESPVLAVYPLEGGPLLSQGRNRIACYFLTSPCEWLWMVDTDIVFDPATLTALLACADPEERPLISAVYQLRISGRMYFAMFTAKNDDEGRFRLAVVENPPASELIPVLAVGCGCLLAHRSVFERINKNCPDDNLWFAEAKIDGEVFGEDVSFCFQAAAAGIPLFVHTGIQVGHIKSAMFGEKRTDGSLIRTPALPLPPGERLRWRDRLPRHSP